MTEAGTEGDDWEGEQTSKSTDGADLVGIILKEMQTEDNA